MVRPLGRKAPRHTLIITEKPFELFYVMMRSGRSHIIFWTCMVPLRHETSWYISWMVCPGRKNVPVGLTGGN